jgi:hypothetical protein
MHPLFSFELAKEQHQESIRTAAAERRVTEARRLRRAHRAWWREPTTAIGPRASIRLPSGRRVATPVALARSKPCE